MSRSLSSEPYAQMLRMLVDARRNAGLNQSDVADRLGKPQSFISKIERAERRLDVVELIVVLQALGVEPLPMLMKIIDQIEPELRL